MTKINEPHYDEDVVNFGYLKRALGINDQDRVTIIINRNYGTAPNPPYRINDTYMDGDKIYICIRSRDIGEFNPEDWQLQDVTGDSVYAVKESLKRQGYVNISADNITSGTLLGRKITNGNGFSVDEDGNMISKSGQIGGWDIKDNELTNGVQFINKKGYSNVYTVADLYMIRLIMLGEWTPNKDVLKHYDLNGDGEVDISDFAILTGWVIGKS